MNHSKRQLKVVDRILAFHFPDGHSADGLRVALWKALRDENDIGYNDCLSCFTPTPRCENDNYEVRDA